MPTPAVKSLVHTDGAPPLVLRPVQREANTLVWIGEGTSGVSINAPGRESSMSYSAKTTTNGVIAKSLKLRVYDPDWVCGDVCKPEPPYVELDVNMRWTAQSSTTQKSKVLAAARAALFDPDVVTVLTTVENFY